MSTDPYDQEPSEQQELGETVNVAPSTQPEIETPSVYSYFDSQYNVNKEGINVLKNILQYSMALNMVKVRGCSPQFAMYSLSLLSSGNSGSPIAYGCLVNEHPCLDPVAIKILPRRKVRSLTDPGWIEVSMLKQANEELITPKHTPHIATHMASFECQGNILEQAEMFFNSAMDRKVFLQRLNTLAPKSDENYNGGIFVLLAEKAKHQSLTQVVKTLPTELWTEYMRMITFQVLWSMVCLQRKYPGFRHNDVWSSNVLITDSPSSSSLYRVSNDEQYLVIPSKHLPTTHVRHTAKLWDFEYACSMDQQNDKVDGTKNGMINNGNPYYDAHFFLNHLYGLLNHEAKNRMIIVPDELGHFFGRMLPEGFVGVGRTEKNPRGSEYIKNFRLTIEAQSIAQASGLKTPLEMLRDSFFDVYRNTKTKSLASTDVYTLPQSQ